MSLPTHRLHAPFHSGPSQQGLISISHVDDTHMPSLVYLEPLDAEISHTQPPVTSSIRAQSSLPLITSIFMTLESFMAKLASHTRLLVTPSPTGQSSVGTSGEVPAMVTSVMEVSLTMVTNFPAMSVGAIEVTPVSSVGLPGSLGDPGLYIFCPTKCCGRNFTCRRKSCHYLFKFDRRRNQVDSQVHHSYINGTFICFSYAAGCHATVCVGGNKQAPTRNI